MPFSKLTLIQIIHKLGYKVFEEDFDCPKEDSSVSFLNKLGFSNIFEKFKYHICRMIQKVKMKNSLNLSKNCLTPTECSTFLCCTNYSRADTTF
jgi:hypothetical protein